MSNGLNAYQFALPLNDLGSGQVNLVPARAGSPTPTFTRATTRTTISSAGLVIPVSSGVAASYYDPTTLQYMGYLAEGQRTNLLLRSEEFDNASWTKTDTTVTADAAISPDGTQNADLLTEGTAGTAFTQQLCSATADVPYATTLYVKRGNTDWLRFRTIDSTGTDGISLYFNVATGAIGSSAVHSAGSFVGADVEALPGGWYRVQLVARCNNGRTAILWGVCSATANGNGTRVNNATYYAWGAQFEDNASFASSYIPTTSATVTRNADVLTYPFAGNASASAGACYAELGTEWATAPSGGTVAVGCTASNSNNQFLRIGGTGLNTQMAIGDGTNFATKSGLTSMATAPRERVSSWGAGGLVVTGDGAVVATGSFDGAMGSTALSVGCATDGATPWFGTIKNVRIWQQQLSDSQLQAITAG